MSLWTSVYNKFWSEWFWLPVNRTWDDLTPEAHPDIHFTNPNMLLLIIPVSISYLLMRSILTKYVFEPIGKSYGIKSKHTHVAKPNPILEAAYQNGKLLTSENIIGLAKQSELNERQIERWWRVRTVQDSPTVLDKFSETAFQLIYYCISFTVGVSVLYDKPYTYDFQLFLKDHPFHSHTAGNSIYMIMTISYYLSLTISHFRDARRKDFWQMLFHHVNAVIVYSLSYVTNFTFATSFVTLLHDTGDILLYSTKIFKYLKMNTAAKIAFFSFFTALLITRIGFYGRVVYVFLTFNYISYYPAGIICLSSISLLYLLHCFWAYLAARLIYIAYKTRKNTDDQQDIRSENSSVSETDNSADEDEDQPESDKLKKRKTKKIVNESDKKNDNKSYLDENKRKEE